MSMTLPDDIDLQISSYGWIAAVPISRGTLFGQRVRLHIQTRDCPEESHPPFPNETELKLAASVLADLEHILSAVDTQFTSYNTRIAPNAIFHGSDPCIWIHRKYLENGTIWAFLVSLEDAPDFGYHIEFDGLICTDIWAGD